MSTLRPRNFLGKGQPNWLDFVVDEISLVDFPAVPDANVVALKRLDDQPADVAEVVKSLKALTAEQMAEVRAAAEKAGNIQGIIDAWDSWAGSFTRCVETLRGKEGITTPEALCAWLHHEAEGKWPGEGE